MFPLFRSSFCFMLKFGLCAHMLNICLWLCFAQIFVCMLFAMFYTQIYICTCLCASFQMFYHAYVLAFTCSHACCHAYAQIYIFICLCAQIYALLALCHLPCTCTPHSMFVCLDLGYVCHAMCYCSSFVALSFFLVFWPIGSNLIQTLWSLPSSMPLGPHQRVWITHFACLSCLSALCLFHILFASLLPLLVYQFLVFAFACTHMELGHSLPGVGKMGKETIMQIWAKWLGSINIGVQPFPFGYVLFQTPSFLLPFSLRWFVLGISCHVPFVLISRVWRPLLFSCTYILGHALGMQAFTFPLCVLALCMMYVFIYLLVLSGVIIIVCVT